MSLADDNNNPLNIKYGSATSKWVDQGHAVVGSKATDGGSFLKFNDPSAGFAAAYDLLHSPLYFGATVDNALNKWSNKGYGAEAVGIAPDTKLNELNGQQWTQLIHGMAKREGYTGQLPTGSVSDSQQQGGVSTSAAGGSTTDTPLRPLGLTPVSANSQQQASPVQGDTAVDIPQSDQQEQQNPLATAFLQQQHKAAEIMNKQQQTLEYLQKGGNVTPTGGGTGAAATSADESSVGFWPKFLAIAAALSGNFGPAMQLQEQERKTAAFKQWQPMQAEINRLVINGKFDDAIALSGRALAALGPRAPELAQQINKTTEDIKNSQIGLRTMTGIIGSYEPLIGKGDIREPILRSMKARVNSGIPVAPEERAAFLDQMKLQPHLLPGTGTIGQTSSGVAGVQQIPTTYLHQPEDFEKTSAGKIMQARSGMDSINLAKFLNGQVAVNKQGQQIAPTPENLAQVRNAWSEEEGKLGAQEVSARVPGEPTVNSALREIQNPDGSKKYTEAQIADKNQIAPADMRFALDRVRRIAAATGTGQAEADWNAPAGTGRTTVVPFHLGTGNMNENMSPAEASQSPEYANIPRARIPQAAQLIQLRNHLNVIADAIRDLPDKGNLGSRFADTVDRVLNRKLQFDDNMTGRQVLEAIVHGDVENYANTKGVSATTYQDLSNGLIGAGATKQTAAAVLAKYNTILGMDLNQLRNEAAASRGGASQGASINVPQRQPKFAITGAGQTVR